MTKRKPKTQKQRGRDQRRAELQRQQDKEVVSANVLAGLSNAEIVKATNIPEDVVSELVLEIIGEWQSEPTSDATVQLRRIDRLINAVWGDAMEGDMKAVSAVRDLIRLGSDLKDKEDQYPDCNFTIIGPHRRLLKSTKRIIVNGGGNTDDATR